MNIRQWMETRHTAFLSALVSTIALVSLTACGASSEQGDTGDTDDTAKSDQVGTVTAKLGSAVMPLSTHGGGGGSLHQWPNQNRIINTLTLHTGAYVDNIYIRDWLPAPGDNSPTSNTGHFGPFGGGGGVAQDPLTCLDGQAAVGFYGRSGNYVDNLGLVCADWNLAHWITTTASYGGLGGGYFYDICPDGWLMSRVNVRSGTYVDQVQGFCSPVE